MQEPNFSKNEYLVVIEIFFFSQLVSLAFLLKINWLHMNGSVSIFLSLFHQLICSMPIPHPFDYFYNNFRWEYKSFNSVSTQKQKYFCIIYSLAFIACVCGVCVDLGFLFIFVSFCFQRCCHQQGLCGWYFSG